MSELSWIERKKIEKVEKMRKMYELLDWELSLNEYKKGCEDSEKGMLSSKVKVGKKWYRKSDRRK